MPKKVRSVETARTPPFCIELGGGGGMKSCLRFFLYYIHREYCKIKSLLSQSVFLTKKKTYKNNGYLTKKKKNSRFQKKAETKYVKLWHVQNI